MAITSACQQAWLGFLFFTTVSLSPALAQGAKSSSSASLTTFITFPTESIGQLTSTVTTETHTVVTASGKTTAVPVLPNHEHGCYFCPTGIGGFVLSGFTKPGVYPTHTVSGFPSPFPEITVGSAGDPSFKKVTQSGSSTDVSTKSSAVTTAHSSSTASSGSSTKASSESKTKASTKASASSSSFASTSPSTKETSSSTKPSASSSSKASASQSSKATTLSSTQTTGSSNTHSNTDTKTSSDAHSSPSTTAHSTSQNGTAIVAPTSSQSSTNTKVSSTESKSSSSASSKEPTSSGSTKAPSGTTARSSTKAKSSSSSSLSSITIFPTETPATVTTSTITSNSKTTETSNGHTTVLPVLPKFGSGGGLCWFCPHSGGGFVLSGFPKPGIYPTGNLPGFPTPVPQITIGPDLIPTFSAEPSDKPTASDQKTSSSDKKTSTSDQKTTSTKSDQTTTTTTSSACSKVTASDCKVITSFSVSGSSTATKVSTSCAEQTACSAHGTTSASATTTTATGCWAYDYTFEADDDSDSNAKRDDLDAAGHRVLHHLMRRGAPKTATSVGNCKLATLAATPMTTPGYPAASTLQNAAGASYWFVPTTELQAGQHCPIVTMTQFANLAALTAAPVMTHVLGGGGTYQDTQPKGKNAPPYVDSDHVYELSLMKDFLADVIGSMGVSCTDFNNFFMVQDAAHSNDYRLQIILDQLPSNTNPDFAGMDHDINALKGKMFNPGLSGIPNPKNDGQRIQLAMQMGAAFDFVNSGDIAKLFKNANTRIYNAWKGIDNLIANGCKGTGPKPNGKDWADAYSTWMTDFIQARNGEITKKLDSIISTNAKSPVQLTDGVKAFNAKYGRADWGWKQANLLDWTAGSPIAINKRDAVCSASASATSGSVSATTTKSASPTSTGKSSTSSTSKKTTLTTSTQSSSSKPTSSSSKASASSTKVTSTSAESSSSTAKSTAAPSSSSSASRTSTVPASTTSTAASGPTACEENQILGSCTQASLPSATPDSGTEEPVCIKVGTNNYVRISADKAQSAATTYCQNLVSGKTVIDASNTAPKPGTESGAAEDNGELALTVLFDVDSCDPGTATADQKVDFGAMGVDTCFQNLYTALAQFCAEDNSWPDYNADYTLQGGTWASSCAIWSMTGSTA